MLLDAFPKEKQGAAQTVFGIAALLAPVVGPTLGGYITDNYGWRWIFYLNVPVGLLALVMCRAVVSDPAYLKAQSAEAAQTASTLRYARSLPARRHDDFLGSHAQQRPGMGLVRRSIFSRANAGLAVRAWSRRPDLCARRVIANPLINFRTLTDRNFRVCCIIIFCAFAVLYANTASSPGVAAIALRLRCDDLRPGALARGNFRDHHALDRRRLFAPRRRCALSHGRGSVRPGRRKLLDVAIESRNQSLANRLAARRVHRRPLHDFRSAQCGGLSVHSTRNCAARRSVCSRSCATKAAASALRSLKQFSERRDQFHSLRLGENLDPLNPAVNSYLDQVQPGFLQQTGDPVAAKQMALQSLANLREQQSSALAYFDVFFIFAVVAVALVVLVFFMKRSVAAKDAHVAAE